MSFDQLMMPQATMPGNNSSLSPVAVANPQAMLAAGSTNPVQAMGGGNPFGGSREDLFKRIAAGIVMNGPMSQNGAHAPLMAMMMKKGMIPGVR